MYDREILDLSTYTVKFLTYQLMEVYGISFEYDT